MNSTTFTWDSVMALVGPATVPLNIGSGHATGAITFPANAHSNHTREILITATSGNFKAVFLNRTTAVVIPVVKGRYPWAVTKVYTCTGGVAGTWGFY